ncbi:MAG: lysophospholipid acyltransferase family protein [Verrucomicrobiae bacterium]|nr:lysophospholipid acyltransferase family protein [Verrucomicrobiae bacterium]
MPSFGENFVWFWVRRALGRSFFSVHIQNADVLRGLKGPAIIFCNHSGWWDTFLCLFLKRHFGFQAWGMMEKKHLRNAAFLKWIGVFGVDLDSPRGAVEGLREALQILEGGGVIFLFPQGRHQPFSVRPIEFRPGLEWLVQKCPGTRLTGVAIRYESLWESRPQIFVSARECPSRETAGMRECLTRLMEGIDDDIRGQDFAGYDRVQLAPPSINKRWDRFKALFTGRKVDPYNT